MAELQNCSLFPSVNAVKVVSLPEWTYTVRLITSLESFLERSKGTNPVTIRTGVTSKLAPSYEPSSTPCGALILHLFDSFWELEEYMLAACISCFVKCLFKQSFTGLYNVLVSRLALWMTLEILPSFLVLQGWLLIRKHHLTEEM